MSKSPEQVREDLLEGALCNLESWSRELRFIELGDVFLKDVEFLRKVIALRLENEGKEANNE